MADFLSFPTDGNTGTDSIASRRISRPLADTGTGSDARVVHPTFGLSDSGIGDAAESEVRGRNEIVPDTGAGIDANYVFLSGVHVIADAGSGSDADTVGSRSADTGSLADYVTLILSGIDEATMEEADPTIASELEAAESVLLTDDSKEQSTDFFVLSESGSISQGITSADVLYVTEHLARTKLNTGYVRASVREAAPYIRTAIRSGYVITSIRKVGKVVDRPVIFE